MKIKCDRTPMSGELGDFQGPAMLIKVDETKWERLWDDLVRKHHYLGYESVIGSRVKYIIALDGKVVGAISFCSAAFKLGLRDKFVGWDEATRLSMLPRLVNNNRFLILPWVRIHNLASHVLSLSLKQLRTDWEQWYGVEPYMAETFVDSERYPGTCYVAANWIRLGTTKGFGRQGNTFVYHGRRKDLFVKIMSRRLISAFHPDISRLPKDEGEEFLAAVRGLPHRRGGAHDGAGEADLASEKIASSLASHLSPYLGHLNRKELRGHFAAMAKGLLGPLPRKSIDPIATNYGGRSRFRSLVNFMGESTWDDQGMLKTYQGELAKELSSPGGMLCVDSCEFPKAGEMSVGVHRQPCGPRGRMASCQAGVFLSYAGDRGHGLVDYELYMPEKWHEDSFKAKRDKCGVPEGLEYKTKSQLAQELINKASAAGLLQHAWVGWGGACGLGGAFHEALPDGARYFADVPSDHLVFLRRSGILPEGDRKGHGPRLAPDAVAVTAQDAVESDGGPWSSAAFGIGESGPLIARDKRLAVMAPRGGLPGGDVWLYARMAGDGDVRYSLCNAPMDAPIEAIRAPAMMRWSAEQTFQECKRHLGMGHYEVRSWTGWRRHMLLVLICHLFVTKLRLGLDHGPGSPAGAPCAGILADLAASLDAAESHRKGTEIASPGIGASSLGGQSLLSFAGAARLLGMAFPPMEDICPSADGR